MSIFAIEGCRKRLSGALGSRITIDLTNFVTHIIHDTYYSEYDETNSEVYDPAERIGFRDQQVAAGGVLGYDEMGDEYVRQEFNAKIRAGKPPERI